MTSSVKEEPEWTLDQDVVEQEEVEHDVEHEVDQEAEGDQEWIAEEEEEEEEEQEDDGDDDDEYDPRSEEDRPIRGKKEDTLKSN